VTRKGRLPQCFLQGSGLGTGVSSDVSFTNNSWSLPACFSTSLSLSNAHLIIRVLREFGCLPKTWLSVGVSHSCHHA
jgi:hypothetical protein